MKSKIIRGLTIASFLIFLLPFAQFCEGMHKAPAELPVSDTLSVATPDTGTVKIDDSSDSSIPLPPPPPLHENLTETVRPIEPENSVFSFDTGESAYAYAKASIGFIVHLDEIKTFADIATTIMSICYIAIILLSIFMLVQVFRSRYKSVRALAVANIAVLLFSTVAHYFTEMLEHWWQIKYGYYLFILNMVAVLVLCRGVFAERQKE